ncbi:mitochondrial fission regulator 2 isoform X2 [Sceloporus undulatus]|uniref:mitochondrial fission regulator 2 isoform X2 n=1 Tax=Sceloporus undulatus TaxID=8520 RepID=UPI001C4AA79E|nr:mitochondrial fission regulator 2 isoform X2 [Sceloporus undulatus]XP_042302809.1 mitochondrial fission regulator 2 isoform X2 [Sceloporus undulatus]XP_042302810.1 mitochondrial fission regulator 2 isoform X2 [Sceloporus undulatus]
MSLLLNLLRQLLEYYGVPPDQMSLVWERKNYGSTRSFVRRLGKYLSLTPCPRPHFQLVRNMNSLESEQRSIVNSLTPSIADVFWIPDDDNEPYNKFSSDEWREAVTSSMLPVSVPASQKATVVDQDTVRKISTLENELSLLRRQIAALVAVHSAGNDPTCKPIYVEPGSDSVNSSNRSSSGFLQATMSSTPVPATFCNIDMPPPPPVLQSNFDSSNSVIELIKQRQAERKTKNIEENGGWQEVKTVPSMMDVLKDINKVKLRVVERSPGGTPMPKRKKKMQSQWDPAAVIAEALKQKFSSQSNGDDSFDKENRSYGASPFSSPEPPMVVCHISKPSTKQTQTRTEGLIYSSTTKTVIHL